MQEFERKMAELNLNGLPPLVSHNLKPIQKQQTDPFLKLLAIPPSQRQKQDIKSIVKILRRLKLFETLLRDRSSSFKDILPSLANYIQAKRLRKLQVGVVTGLTVQHFLIFYEGKVGIWKPENSRAYENSVKMNKHKKDNKNHSENKPLHVKMLESDSQEDQRQKYAHTKLSREQVQQYLRNLKYMNELANPHVFSGYLEPGTVVSGRPLEWKYEFDAMINDSIGVCFEDSTFLTLRHQFYREINKYLDGLHRKMSIKILLKFYKQWNYYDVVPYVQDNPMLMFEPKCVLQLEANQLYIVCEGEVEIGLKAASRMSLFQAEVEQTESAFKNSLLPLLNTVNPVKYRQLITVTSGELIGKDDLKDIQYMCLTKVRLLKMKGQVLQQQLEMFEGLRTQIDSLLLTRKNLLDRAIENSYNTSQLFDPTLQARIRSRRAKSLTEMRSPKLPGDKPSMPKISHNGNSQGVAKPTVQQALQLAHYIKDKSKKEQGQYYTKLEEDVKKTLIQRSKSVTVCVQSKSSKMIRGGIISGTDTSKIVQVLQKFITEKSDKLKPEQVTNHNINIVRAKYSVDLSAPINTNRSISNISEVLAKNHQIMMSKQGKVSQVLLGLRL